MISLYFAFVASMILAGVVMHQFGLIAVIVTSMNGIGGLGPVFAFSQSD